MPFGWDFPQDSGSEDEFGAPAPIKRSPTKSATPGDRQPKRVSLGESPSVTIPPPAPQRHRPGSPFTERTLMDYERHPGTGHATGPDLRRAKEDKLTQLRARRDALLTDPIRGHTEALEEAEQRLHALKLDSEGKRSDLSSRDEQRRLLQLNYDEKQRRLSVVERELAEARREMNELLEKPRELTQAEREGALAAARAELERDFALIPHEEAKALVEQLYKASDSIDYLNDEVNAKHRALVKLADALPVDLNLPRDISSELEGFRRRQSEKASQQSPTQ